MKSGFLLSLVLLTGCTSVQTQVEINAPAKTVSAVLYKFDDYPQWNPFIRKVDGTVAEGKTVNVTVQPVGKAEISGDTTIVSATEKHLSWRGSLRVPGIFHGEHEFVIEEVGPNRTLLYQREKMSGLIIPFYDFKPTEAGFVAMNNALKQKAEDAGR
jgi:hypothetical protein